jgi:hypothetical protein
VALKEKLEPEKKSYRNLKSILTELKPNEMIYGINLKQKKIAAYMKQNKRIL